MRDYMLTLLVAAAVSYLTTPLVRRLAARFKVMTQPRERDVHTRPVPLIGGVAMYAGLAAGLFAASQIPQLRDAIASTGMVSGLLLAGALLVVVGIIDDKWGMSALTKAAGQVAAGGILVATGTQLNWLPLPGGGIFELTSDQATVLTVLVIVATINAVNFIDGLDGLAAGIVAIAAISFFIYYYSLTTLADISRLAAPALASALLIGMCLGFLPHNFSPASIFMGDTGSMLLGLVLAYAPISSISSLDGAELASRFNRYPEIMPFLLPAALLVIPYGDLLLAVVRRTRAGRSPFAPDRKHLHHRLLDIGHSQRASVLIMYLWAAAFSGTVVWLSIERTERPKAADHHGEPVIVFVAITVAAVAVLLLMSMPWPRWLQRSAPQGTFPAAPAVAGPEPAPAVAGPEPAAADPAPVPAASATAVVSAGQAARANGHGTHAPVLVVAGTRARDQLTQAGPLPAPARLKHNGHRPAEQAGAAGSQPDDGEPGWQLSDGESGWQWPRLTSSDRGVRADEDRGEDTPP